MLSRVTISDVLFTLGISFIAGLAIPFFYGLSQIKPEVVECHIIDCTDNSINVGSEKVHLSFECVIEKSECSDDCRLGTRILSKGDFESLWITKNTHCKYIEGGIYLGKESYTDDSKEVAYMCFVLLSVAYLAYFVYMFDQISKRGRAVRQSEESGVQKGD